MKKLIWIIYIVTFFCNISNAQTQKSVEMWTKFSPEIRMNIENTPWEFRLRPDDHIFLPSKYVPYGSLARVDLMVGLNLWKFKIFSYTKYDQNGGFWTGPRLDFNFDAFNHKLLFNIQERYFFALDSISKDHYYLIQYIRYQITNGVAIGALSYGKWNIDQEFKDGYWFIGPSIELAVESGFSLQVALTKDIYHEVIYMSYIKLGYKFTIKDHSKPITIDDE
jgi:hypothetical protein